MSNSKIIIIAAGSGERWGNHLGVVKHMVPVNGMPLIHDTVSKFKSMGDITIVCRPDTIDIPDGCDVFHPQINPENHDADKFLNSHQLWNKNGRTIILYGDVFFSNYSVSVIKLNNIDWVWYSRFGSSGLLGKSWGENFAISFMPNHHEHLLKSLVHIVNFNQTGTIDRSGGWEWYRQCAGLPLNVHLINGNFIDINDITDDFDYPSDYEKWIKIYSSDSVL